jgi:hypothetical protein
VNTSTPHPFFVTLLGRFIGIDDKMIRRLWAKLYPSEVQPLIIQADFVGRSSGPDGVEMLAQRLSPQLLITACRRLSPEDGQRRDRAVVETEERILKRVGADGRWE